MPLKLKPVTKLTYKLKLTPQVRLGINLLQMPLIKLKEFIEQQVEENPSLDVETVEPFNRENYNSDNQGKGNYRESLVTKPVTLGEHLLRQLHLLTASDQDYKIGELLISNIDDDGYLNLGSSVEEIAKSAQAITSSAENGSQPEAEVSLVHASSGKIEKILSLIQTFTPTGVGARTLRECLLIQLKAKGNLSPDLSSEAQRAKEETLARGKENPLVFQIVDKYLPYLEEKRFKFIAKKLSASGGKVSIKKIKEAMKEIAHLEPKPGRSFSTERTVYLAPDAFLKKNKGAYEVIFNNWELPHLTLNEKYKQMIKQKDTPLNTKKYLQERITAAQTLISAVEKRKQTIQEVTKAIVYHQKDFLDKGEANFKPMTLEKIAKQIGKHKSTISRAMTNKYIQTPWGILELRFFLNSGIKQDNEKVISSKAIKSKMKDLIADENKEKPLSDQKITKLLEQEGICVCRRTIAKYRNQFKIPPSQSRRV
ncbi:RNA polymerase factor sigma-54 [Patescibacteria group bacterium]|nr:RNA polymerase factor sigma-54 [Patescibacteria group bacterium]